MAKIRTGGKANALSDGRWAMSNGKRKMLQGVSRKRRPKTGTNKGLLILLSHEEKMRIERQAAKRGISMSRFIVECALQEAQKVL